MTIGSQTTALRRRDALASRAAVGGTLWLAGMVLLGPPLEVALLTLAPLVVVPLALRVMEPPRSGLERRAHRAAVGLQLPAAALLLAGFALPRGVAAALLALPWLAETLLLAAWGLLRLGQIFREGEAPAEQHHQPTSRLGGSLALPTAATNGVIYKSDAHTLAEVAALLLLPVGAGWTLLARLGGWSFGFEPIIVLLTGVHFHYAGFALPVLLARQADVLPRRAHQTAVALVVAGIPVVALGMTFSPVVEIAAVAMLVLGALLVAVGQLRLARRATSAGELTLFCVSGFSLLGGMTLALLYAVGQFVGHVWIDIPTMIPLHGLANGVGFALLGLLAWNVRRPTGFTSPTRKRGRTDVHS